MPINKFKFVSPGVQVAEIDNSQRTATPEGPGPVIIGRAARGPGLRPIKVSSFSEFVQVFGMPWAGHDTEDIWRYGNKMAPSYGVYAAQAYLKNSGPLTFVRLLGKQNEDATEGTQVLGSAGWVAGATSTTGSGGNYGLFLINSSSTNVDQTGTLAAVFYSDDGAVVLRGNGLAGSTTTGMDGLIQTVGTNYELQAVVLDSVGNDEEVVNFNFSRNSQKYIRKVFNTNPTTINEEISTANGADSHIFLGESYDRDVAELMTSLSDGGSAGQAYGMITRLADAAETITQNNRLRDSVPAETGWVVSQYLGASGSFAPQSISNGGKLQRLFKIKSLNAGEWESQNFKVSISDIAAPTSELNPFGTFTVEVRNADDNDSAPEFVERFASCNLNPNSPNYISRKIGDKFEVWDAVEARYREFGTYNNNSNYVFVEVAPLVGESMANEAFLPFGFEGPPRWRSWEVASGSVAYPANSYATGTADTGLHIPAIESTTGAIWTDSSIFTGSFKYPTINYRLDSKQGGPPAPGDAYFGYDTGRSGSTNTYEDSNIDIVRAFPFGIDAHGNTTTFQTASVFNALTDTVVASVFTLDELRFDGGTDSTSRNAQWFPGCHVAGNSINTSGSADAGFATVLEAGFDKFTLPLFGGYDGENILESDPFNARVCADGPAPSENYAVNSIRMAIDSVADPEVVNSNLMAIPGNYNAGITSHLLNTCERRADSLAVIDLDGGYEPAADAVVTVTNGIPMNVGSVARTISNLRDRALNSSYGCAYYPWVQIRDETSSQLLFAPPSIAAIGTFSSAQNASEVWFAPAGFTRGGLTEGAAGLPVVGVAQRLNSSDRDKLYEANINPIATFPAEGIVMFGQKTLQVTPSALDRINVRRLMIHVKKNISYIASRLLFDQNVSVTWDRFLNNAEPFLESIKQRLGLMAYKVVLDETTTTPDLIDRNILYAKIFLKPARAIEFIAIDFVITNSGASFED